jgi:hypothetical protein
VPERCVKQLWTLPGRTTWTFCSTKYLARRKVIVYFHSYTVFCLLIPQPGQLRDESHPGNSAGRNITSPPCSEHVPRSYLCTLTTIIKMASQPGKLQYIPLSPLSVSQLDNAVGQKPGSPRLEARAADTLDNLPSDAYSPVSLRRRRSSASSISLASSQAQVQAGQPFKQVLARTKELTHKFDVITTRWLRGSRYCGWRMGVLCGSCMTSFVLLCNVAIVIVGAIRNGGYQNGIADLVSGGAPYISNLSTIFHLLINAGSTMLLGASNYTMQVMCSPTRHDIDVAHARGQWLDVGLLSFRNLRAIPRTRAALWLVLALSSIPLHLL